MTKSSARQFRELRIALGMDGPLHHLPRLLPVLAGVIALIALAAAMSVPTGPPVTVYGTVTGLGFAETDDGSKAYAMARIGSQDVRVRLRPHGLCRVGDRIAVVLQKTLLGERHRPAFGGCRRTG